MNENNIKALFPEGIETITISKNDYDRLYGQLTYQNMVLQSKIDKAIEYIKENIDLGMDDFPKIEIGYGILEILDLDKYNEFLKEDK